MGNMGLVAVDVVTNTSKVEGWGKDWMQRYRNLGAVQDGACWGLGLGQGQLITKQVLCSRQGNYKHGKQAWLRVVSCKNDIQFSKIGAVSACIR